MSEDRWYFLTVTRLGYTNRRPAESIEQEIADGNLRQGRNVASISTRNRKN